MERETKRYIIYSSGKVYSKRFKKYLTPLHTGNGFLSFSLYYGDRAKTMTIHRLIAGVFIPNPKKKNTVIHLDGNKHNNNFRNLRWATLKENVNYNIEKGFIVRKYNNGVGRKKIKVTVFDKSGSRLTTHESIGDAARHYEVLTSSVSKILKGKRHHTKNLHFKHAKAHENIS